MCEHYILWRRRRRRRRRRRKYGGNNYHLMHATYTREKTYALFIQRTMQMVVISVDVGVGAGVAKLADFRLNLADFISD